MNIITLNLRSAMYGVLILLSLIFNINMLAATNPIKNYPDCTAPKNLSVDNSELTKAFCSWEGDVPSRKTHFYRLRYRPVSQVEWIVLEEERRLSITLEELETTEDYRIEVQKVCYGNKLEKDFESEWIGVDVKAQESRNNTADSVCALLTYYEAQPYQSGIMVNWEGPTAQPGLNIYRIGYKRTDSNDWNYVDVTNGDQYYIADLINEQLYDVSIRYSAYVDEIYFECDELFMGPILVLRPPSPPPPDDDDPVITLPDFECGETYDPDPITNQVPLSIADTSDIFFIGGFPIKLTDVSGGAGLFSGTGIVPLPFSEKTLTVYFENVSVNTDFVIHAGEVLGTPDAITNYPDIPNEPFYIGDDICQPPPGAPGFDDDGIYQPDGTTTDPNGFGPDGTYTQQPPYEGYEPGDPFDPNYDPNGFGPDGTYLDSGSPYNPQGCSQLGLDADGQPCNPEGEGPYWWLDENPGNTPPTGGGILLANTVDSLLMDLIVACLDSLENEARDSIEAITPLCNGIKGEIDVILQSHNHIVQVTGESEEYTITGMHQQFSNNPEILSASSNTRSGVQIDLEKKHVDLFQCDKRLHKYIYWLEVIINAFAEPDISNFEADLIEKLKRLSDVEANDLLNDSDALLQWVYDQTDEKIYDDLVSQYGQDYAYQKEFGKIFNINFGPKTPGFYDRNYTTTYASNSKAIQNLSQDVLDEMNFNFLQGHKYINGTHRAFFLQLIAKQRTTLVTEANQSLLPIVVSKTIAGKEQSIIMDNIVFTPNSARFDAYFVLEPPNSGNKAVFELINIGFGPTGIPENDVPMLRLVNDVGIRLNNAARLNILGGENTFVAIDCDGFAGMGVEAEIEFCREYLIPLNPVDMEPIPEDSVRVKAHFIAEMPAWGEFLAELNFDPFALGSAPDTKFTVSGAMLDLSDSQKIPGIVFPPNYESPFVVSGNASPLWKGFYLNELTVTLPNKFTDNNEPVTGGVRDVIIDGMGFTGEVFLSPILSLENGNLGGWAFSIDEFRLGVVSNKIKAGGLTGLINVPFLSSPDNTTDEITAADCLQYVGVIDANNTYSFTVSPNQVYRAKLWKANVNIDPTSAVTIKLVDDNFLAEARLNGSLSIDADFTSSINVNIPTIPFTGVTIRNQAPHFKAGTWHLPSEIGADFAGFGLTIGNPTIINNESNNEVALQFTAGLRLNQDEEASNQDSGDPNLSADGSFSVIGEMITIGGRQKWRYKDFDVHEFCIQAGGMPGVNYIDGCLAFFDEEDWSGTTNWGTGFRGMLTAEFSLKKLDIGLSIVGQFGNIKSGTNPFKYFMLDGLAVMSEGIPLGPVGLYGFGGGASYNMARLTGSSLPGADTNPNPTIPSIGLSLSGTQFVPDNTIGLGIFANVVIGTAGNPHAFNFNATLGAEFNTGGGFSQIYFNGNARFMADLELTADPTYNVNGGNPLNGAAVSAYVSLKMDFNSGVFDGLFDVYVNVNDNIVGVKDKNKPYYFGGCEMSFGSSDGWYINLGKPSYRNALEVQIPGTDAGVKFTSYLNIGTDIEPMPDPPSNVMRITGASNFMANESRRASGNGFAFGASLDVDTGDLRFLMFYASFQAGLGFDINLQRYDDVFCINTNDELGINGWYASGQVWGYFEGEIGIKTRLWGRDIEAPIIQLGAAAILQAKLPNPFWAKATVGGYYSILGGLIKGDCDFEVTIGKSCQYAPGSNVDPQFPLILAMSPNNNERNVSTMARPTIDFGMPIDLSFEEGGVSYKVVLDEVKVETQNGDIIPFIEEWSSDKTNLVLTPYYELPGSDTLIFTAEVSVYKNGTQKIDEKIKVHEFVTTENLKIIPLDNIEYSYPIHGQYNYFPAEKAIAGGNISRFYINLNIGQPQLLHQIPEGKGLFMRLKKGGIKSYTPVSINPEGNEISVAYTKDKFENGGYYSADLVLREIQSGGGGTSTTGTTTTNSSGQSGWTSANSGRAFSGIYKERPHPRPKLVSQRNGGIPSQTSSNSGVTDSNNDNQNAPPPDEVLLNINFRVSEYDSFQEKMDAFFSQAVEFNGKFFSRKAPGFEPFDQFETTTNEMGEPLMKLEWNENYSPQTWYKDLNEKFYQKASASGFHFPISNLREATIIHGSYQRDPVFVPDYQSYFLASNIGTHEPILYLNPFGAASNDINNARNAIQQFVVDNLCDMPFESPDEIDCEGLNSDFWANQSTWLKTFYNGTVILHPNIKVGSYGGILKYSLPGQGAFQYEFTLTKPAN